MLLQTLLGSGELKDKLIFIGMYLIVILVSLSFHEWAHAYTAHRMGDDTARNLGRMTVNPFAHIHVYGFLLLLVAGFGWAKPVPVNPRNYRNYKLGEFLVSSAGIFTNLVIAFIAAIAFCCTLFFGFGGGGTLWEAFTVITKEYGASGAVAVAASVGDFSIEANLLQFFYMFGVVNCSLAIFNLLPLYPLDGYRLFELAFGRFMGSSALIWLHNNGHYVLYGLLIISTLLARTFGFSPISVAANWLYSLFVKGAGGIFGLFI